MVDDTFERTHEAIAATTMASSISDVEKLHCVESEIAMRKRVYPNLVENRRITQAKADREIAVMEAIAAEYRQRMISAA